MRNSQLRSRERAAVNKEDAVALREAHATAAEIAAKSAALDVTLKQFDQKLSAWKALLDVATHFNEICLNVRRFALATLATLLAAAGVAYRFGGDIPLHHPEAAGLVISILFAAYLLPIALTLVVRGRPKEPAESAGTTAKPTSYGAPKTSLSGRDWTLKTRLAVFIGLLVPFGVGSYHVFGRPIATIHVASLFVAVAAVVWILCFLMDRFWYHELLRGVTAQCAKLEESLADLANLSVTTEIRRFSHASLSLSAGAKLSVFYLFIYAILIATLAALLVFAQAGSPPTSREILGSRGAFETYQLEPLPAFEQGSSDLTAQAREAICASRAALAAMRTTSVIVVASHDQVELRPDLKRKVSSNASLARHRAERVAEALRGATPCPSPAVPQVVALDSPPLQVGRSVQSAALESDRRAIVYALRMVSPLLASSSGSSR